MGMVKNIAVISFLWVFFIPLAFSQYSYHGHFLKRIEYNLIMLYDVYNLKSKGDIEKLFFFFFNAPVEFSYLPSSEAAFETPPSGLRIVKNASNTSCILEVKYISNYVEAHREATKKHPMIGVSNPSSITDEERNQIIEHNRAAIAKHNAESLNLFKVDTLSYPISNDFAENLYKKTVLFIDNFKAKGVPPLIVDGYLVTFRTVVEDEVWSLWIHMPDGDALKMADICRQIITDAYAGKLDESKYIKLLDNF
jgi:hypothetical protein